jgi:hypothetical protein
MFSIKLKDVAPLGAARGGDGIVVEIFFASLS